MNNQQNQANNQVGPANNDGVPYQRGQAVMVFEEWCLPGDCPFQHWMSSIPEQEAISLARRGDLGVPRIGCQTRAMNNGLTSSDALTHHVELSRRGHFALFDGPWACCRCGSWTGTPFLIGKRSCNHWNCKHKRCRCCRPQNVSLSEVPRREQYHISREDDAALGEPTAAEQVQDPAPDPYADEWQPRPEKRRHRYFSRY